MPIITKIGNVRSDALAMVISVRGRPEFADRWFMIFCIHHIHEMWVRSGNDWWELGIRGSRAEFLNRIDPDLGYYIDNFIYATEPPWHPDLNPSRTIGK